MKIGIDARLISETGVGRYIRNLIAELSRIDDKNSYIIYLPKSAYENFDVPNTRWQKRRADVRWHTVREQLIMPWVFLRDGLDLLHVPYFNIPLLYPGKFVVTIHDLTILHFDTGKASTLPYIFYKLRRLGYHILLAAAIGRAEKVIAVSEATKKEITDHFDILPKNIMVTLEGVDEKLKVKSEKLKVGKPLIAGDYFLYVGNAYPHKNVELLVDAIEGIPKQVRDDVKLILVGKDDYFYKRLKQQVRSKRIEFFGPATDTELANLYTHARALVFPSHMEGFGLPVLEALSFGCPVIASDIPVFHELAGDIPMYFDPKSGAGLQVCLEKAIETNVRSDTFTKKALSVLKNYSWQKMAKETLSVYEQS